MAINITRLGSANTYDNALRNLSQRQNALSNLQENLTSGKRVVRASDDPTGAAQAERALTRLERVKTDQRALEAQRNSITSAEGALGEMTDALQNIRELVVSAGNATYTSEQRKSVAIQLTGLRDQVFALANRKDSNGLPLFGALGSALTPFVGPNAPPQDYTFQGLPGQSASSEVAIPYALNGDSAFMHQSARDGVYNVTLSNTATGAIAAGRSLLTSNVTVADRDLVNASAYTVTVSAVDSTSVPGTTTVTYDIAEDPDQGNNAVGLSASYPTDLPANTNITGIPGLSLTLKGTPAVGDTLTITPSTSIFGVLDDAIANIGGAANSNAASQAISQALHNIDIGMTQISAVRGQAGDLLNRADRITSTQSNRSIQLEADRSRAEDLDMIQGIADFQNQQTGYQAALQTYAQVQKLSLFNYIG